MRAGVRIRDDNVTWPMVLTKDVWNRCANVERRVDRDLLAKRVIGHRECGTVSACVLEVKVGLV